MWMPNCWNQTNRFTMQELVGVLTVLTLDLLENGSPTTSWMTIPWTIKLFTSWLISFARIRFVGTFSCIGCVYVDSSTMINCTSGMSWLVQYQLHPLCPSSSSSGKTCYKRPTIALPVAFFLARTTWRMAALATPKGNNEFMTQNDTMHDTMHFGQIGQSWWRYT